VELFALQNENGRRGKGATGTATSGYPFSLASFRCSTVSMASHLQDAFEEDETLE
jgi:hypothetical protein